MGFVHDLRDRLANRVQITSDGHRVYLEAVETAFGSDVDYAMLIKVYGESNDPDTRYSPAQHIATQLSSNQRESRPKTHQHKHGGTAELERPYRNAAVHAPVQWFLSED